MQSWRPKRARLDQNPQILQFETSKYHENASQHVANTVCISKNVSEYAKSAEIGFKRARLRLVGKRAVCVTPFLRLGGDSL